MEIVENKIIISDSRLVRLLHENEQFILNLEKRFEMNIFLRGDTVFSRGEATLAKTIENIIRECEYMLNKNGTLSQDDFRLVMDLFELQTQHTKNNKHQNENSIIYFGHKREPVRTRTPKQEEYFQKVQNNDLVFSVGPAGTGKTYLAVAMALAALKNNEVNRIVVTRPAVEAGESLGYLPGDLQDKIEPYLRPINDAMFSMLSHDTFKIMREKQILEITPLAYMRGRTLNDAFIILDEAQNATINQMKMFLTRLGANSKSIVTGDITQIDLKERQQSGLSHAVDLLQNIKGIGFIFFSNKDIVRHKLVAKILDAYESEKF